jgi:hypothetical protein
VQAVHPLCSGVHHLVLAHAVVDEAGDSRYSSVYGDSLLCIPASFCKLRCSGLCLDDLEPAAICSVAVHCAAAERAPADDVQAAGAHVAH